MRIVHASAWYPPHFIGGTEIYVSGLARELSRRGVDVSVLTPAPKVGERQHEGVTVREYAVSVVDPAGLAEFRAQLARIQPDVFHLHTWTPACGLDHLRAAHEMGLRTVWTPHVPASFCLRGTMLHRGTQPCDGRIDVKRCGACWAESRGLPEWLADAAMHLPAALMARAGFRAHGHVERLREQLAEAGRLADRIVCVSGWLKEVLLLNGLPAEKMVLSRQGVDERSSPQTPRLVGDGHSIHVGFIGRWDPVKGLHVLVDAFKSLPDSAPLRLDIYVRRMTPTTDYERRLRRRIGTDRRIRIFEDAPRDTLRAALAGFDALAVPSQCLETGPLSVLEAAQAGVPVLGSNIGGVAEWLEAGIAGWTVPFDDVAAWQNALLDLPERLRAIPLGQPQPVRTTGDVAQDMGSIYRDLMIRR